MYNDMCSSIWGDSWSLALLSSVDMEMIMQGMYDRSGKLASE